MTTYLKGQPGELPEILDFINMVFSMHRAPHNFCTLLPKLYGDGRQTEPFHYLAKEDGKICAVVCVLPIMLEHDGRTITCATVGSVSVHPYSRGKGYMKQLMAMAVEDMEKDGITLSILSGRRHRYQYYGYEPGGHHLEYQFIADNFRHCAARYPDHALSLSPVDAQDTALIGQLSRCYQEQSVHTIRRERDFFDICSSWDSSLYAIACNGETAGYICGTKDHIYELVLKDDSLLFSALRAWLNHHNSKRLSLSLPAYDTARIRAVSGFYEHFSVQEEDNYRIFNYGEAISFFLSVKAGREPLSDGRLVIKIGDRERLAVSVSAGKITTAPCSDVPDICMTDIEAIDLLFSPASLYGRDPSSPLSAVNWFPLPLSVSHLDKC